MTTVDRKVFSAWAYIARAEDVSGCWVAHCFDYGIVSIGDSPQHAFEMVREAVGITLTDDLNRGFDPNERRAPDEDWAPLLKLFDKHTEVRVSEMDSTSFREFAAQFSVVILKHRSPELELGSAPEAPNAFAFGDAA